MAMHYLHYRGILESFVWSSMNYKCRFLLIYKLFIFLYGSTANLSTFLVYKNLSSKEKRRIGHIKVSRVLFVNLHMEGHLKLRLSPKLNISSSKETELQCNANFPNIISLQPELQVFVFQTKNSARTNQINVYQDLFVILI